MVRGRHFLEVTVAYYGGFGWMAGVVGAGFECKSRWNYEHEHGWMYMIQEVEGDDRNPKPLKDPINGDLYHGSLSKWEGQRSATLGDRIGLLLDLDAGSLAIYKNGERMGLMVPDGIVPPVRWAVILRVHDGASLGRQPAP